MFRICHFVPLIVKTVKREMLQETSLYLTFTSTLCRIPGKIIYIGQTTWSKLNLSSLMINSFLCTRMRELSDWFLLIISTLDNSQQGGCLMNTAVTDAEPIQRSIPNIRTPSHPPIP